MLFAPQVSNSQPIFKRLRHTQTGGLLAKFADDQSSLALDPDLLKKAVVACAASATRRAQTAMSVDTCELAACCNVDMKRKLERQRS